MVFRGQSAHFLNDDEGAGTGLDFLRGVCYAVATQYQSFAKASVVSVFQSVRVFPLGRRGLFCVQKQQNPALCATGGDQSPPTAKGKEKEDFPCKIR